MSSISVETTRMPRSSSRAKTSARRACAMPRRRWVCLTPMKPNRGIRALSSRHAAMPIGSSVLPSERNEGTSSGRSPALHMSLHGIPPRPTPSPPRRVHLGAVRRREGAGRPHRPRRPGGKTTPQGNTDAQAMSRHQVHALSTMNLGSEHQVRVNLGRVDRAVHVGRSLCEGLCIGIAYELTAIRMDTRSHERE